MKKLGIALIAAAAFAAPAFAADMAVRPMKAPIAPVPVFSWTGCYIGAGGGYGMSNNDLTVVDTGIATSSTTTAGGRGWYGTVQGGCDYQVAPNWVIGGFADANFGSIKGHLIDPLANLGGDQKLSWSWAVGGRVGYLPFERLLAYVSGGFTQANYDQVGIASGGVGFAYIPSTKYNGWFLGSGYEYSMSFLPGLFWKTEYRFADYGSHQDPILLVGVGGPTGLVLDSHKYVQTITSELVYRFNWGR